MYPAAFMSWLIGMSQKITSVNRPNLLQIEGEEMQFEKQIWIIGSFIWDFVEVLLQHWQSLCIDLWLEVKKISLVQLKLSFCYCSTTPQPQFSGVDLETIFICMSYKTKQNQTKPDKT